MAEGARTISAVPLDRQAFAPFGEVIETPGGAGRAVNLGTARRFDRAVTLESARPAATPNLALFFCEPQSLPFRATLLERHPHSTQVFAALRGGRWLVVVAPSLPDGRPDERGVRAFACGPGQGINLAQGVWHHPMIALGEPAEMLMLAWEDGGPGDCEEFPLSSPIQVTEALV
jgi:ureidoglycolate lyase